MNLKNVNWKKLKSILALGSTLVIVTTPISSKAFSYKIEKGDTLSKISTKFYGNYSYYKMLAEYNNITDSSKIYAGNIIEVPNLDLLINNGTIYYEIEKGDTLSKISTKFYGDYSYYSELAKYNNIIDVSKIKASDILIIPKLSVLQKIRNYKSNNNETINNTNKNTTTYYEIKRGDTLSKISTKFYGDYSYYAEIAKYNNISDVSKINAGDTIILPNISVLQNIRNNKNNQSNNQTQTTNKSQTSSKKDLYQISKDVYGTDEYAYLISVLNDCSIYKKYNKEDLFLPAKSNIEKYIKLWKSLEPEDTIKNYYIVEKGDTLAKISKKVYGTDKYINFLANINGLENKNVINTGDILYVPGMYIEENKKQK